MHTSVSKIFAFGLLASVPLAAAYAIPSQSQNLNRKDEVGILNSFYINELTPFQGGLTALARSVLPLDAREPHHTGKLAPIHFIDLSG